MWGDEFEALYEQYEREKKFRRTVPAQELWFAILSSQVETGTPYMLFKVPTTLTLDTIVVVEVEVESSTTTTTTTLQQDACNRKSNQQNLGTIKSSNLCTEIVQYTSADEVAVCNLASVNLSAFVDESDKSFDFDKLLQVHPTDLVSRMYVAAFTQYFVPCLFVCVIDCWMQVTKVVTKNLNKVIDINFYPVLEAKNSNFRHRPIGYGPPESPTPTTMIYVM